jgi:glycosyltransferase involved in cell wall biosynthesis
MMKESLAQRLKAAGQANLFEFFDFYPTRVGQFNPNRPSIYWIQDLAVDTNAKHLADDQYVFDTIVFVSHWQQQEFQRRYPMTKQKQSVMPNAIRLFEPNVIQKWNEPGIGSKDRPLRLIYHTTPHRGLELLVPAFDAVWKKSQSQGVHLHLDVYSSFSIYGWEHRDVPYTELFNTCRRHPAITYHGAVPNDEIRDCLRRAHVFAYPSIWPETSCIALIEAMASGCICVHSNLAALPETAGGMTLCYPFVPDHQTHFQIFTQILHAALSNLLSALNQKHRPGMALMAMQRANAIYNWDSRIHEWIGLLSDLKQKIEAEGSRGLK